MKSILALSLATLLLCFDSANAQWHGSDAPDSLSFQGRLTDLAGDPVTDGNYALTFAMYKGASKIWEQVHATVPVSDGVFNVILGGVGTASLDTVAFNEPIDLGIKVGANPEMTPRTPLMSAAYALGMRGLSVVHAEDASNRIAPNLIGGASNNYVAPDVVGATISGGGGIDEGALGADSVLGRWGTVGGGLINTAGPHGTVGGGVQNRALNTATVGGGALNTAVGYASTVGGGIENTAPGIYSMVGGGFRNRATGQSATIAGGDGNSTAGDYSMAAGSRAHANHDGAFVWNDRSENPVTDSLFSTGPNQFIVRAAGGVGIGTNAPGSQLTVHGLVESDSLGFKFPDGSVQTTASTSGSPWALTGNASTTPGVNFIGTTDSTAIEVRVNANRVLRIEPVGDGVSTAPNIIGGASNNFVADGVVGATLGGGGGWVFASGVPDSVLGDFGTVGGGRLNTAGGSESVVGGGLQNKASGGSSTVGGGSNNKASGNSSAITGGSGNKASGIWTSVIGGFLNSAEGDSAVVGGGNKNSASGLSSTVAGGGSNDAGGAHSTIAGGQGNRASGDWASVGGGRLNAASDFDAFVGGGYLNTASGNWSTIGGGEVNSASANRSAVGGGSRNVASGEASTVPGGLRNAARASYTFAAGYNAKADHDGSFVWNDRSQTISNRSDSMYTTAANQFLVRAAGGVGIGTNKPKRGLTISRESEEPAYQLELRNVGNITAPNYDGIAFTQQDSGTTDLASIKVVYQNNGYPDMSLGVRGSVDLLYLYNTGDGDRVGIGTSSPTEKLEVNGNVLANNVVVPSDRRLKRDIRALHNSLAAVSRLSGVSYAWRTDEYPDRGFEDGRHIGFIAQDVEGVVPEAINVGPDGTYSMRYQEIIPLLVEAIKEQQATIASQNQQIDSQSQRLAALEAKLTN